MPKGILNTTEFDVNLGVISFRFDCVLVFFCCVIAAVVVVVVMFIAYFCAFARVLRSILRRVVHRICCINVSNDANSRIFVLPLCSPSLCVCVSHSFRFYLSIHIIIAISFYKCVVLLFNLALSSIKCPYE